MAYRTAVGAHSWVFADLKDLLAKASPIRSGDMLAGIAASCAGENAAARLCLADVPLATFLNEPLVPYEADEVTRLILDTHDTGAFRPIASMTVGEFREFLLAEPSADLVALAPAITPEIAAAVSKIM